MKSTVSDIKCSYKFVLNHVYLKKKIKRDIKFNIKCYTLPFDQINTLCFLCLTIHLSCQYVMDHRLMISELKLNPCSFFILF